MALAANNDDGDVDVDNGLIFNGLTYPVTGALAQAKLLNYTDMNHDARDGATTISPTNNLYRTVLCRLFSFPGLRRRPDNRWSPLTHIDKTTNYQGLPVPSPPAGGNFVAQIATNRFLRGHGIRNLIRDANLIDVYCAEHPEVLNVPAAKRVKFAVGIREPKPGDIPIMVPLYNDITIRRKVVISTLIDSGGDWSGYPAIQQHYYNEMMGWWQAAANPASNNILEIDLSRYGFPPGATFTVQLHGPGEAIGVPLLLPPAAFVYNPDCGTAADNTCPAECRYLICRVNGLTINGIPASSFTALINPKDNVNLAIAPPNPTAAVYFQGNREKNTWFEEPFVRDPTNPADIALGEEWLIGKLVCDLLHVIFCNPHDPASANNDAVVSYDKLVSQRCIDTQKNCIRIGGGGVVSLLRAGILPMAPPPPPNNRDILFATGIRVPADSPAQVMPADIGDVMEDNGAAIGCNAISGAAGPIPKRTPIPLPLPLKKRSNAYTDKVAKEAKVNAAAAAVLSTRDSRARAKRGIAGGSSDMATEQINSIYLEVLLTMLDGACNTLTEFLEVGQITVDSKQYKISDSVNNYVHHLIDFLKSDSLKSHLNEIDKSGDTTSYLAILTEWLPVNLVFHSTDMNTFFSPITDDYYTPQDVVKVFPCQPDIINLGDISFQNRFTEGTFKQFVIQSIPGIPRSDTRIPLKNGINFTDILAQINSTINVPITETNEHEFIKAMIEQDTFPKQIISKAIFTSIIDDIAIACRIYQLYVNMIMFTGRLALSPVPILKFIDIMNREGQGLEFVGGVERIQQLFTPAPSISTNRTGGKHKSYSKKNRNKKQKTQRKRTSKWKTPRKRSEYR